MFNPKDYITQIKGKDYLEVKWRIMWFKDAHPHGTIKTEVLEILPVSVVKCSVFDNDGVLLATGHGSAAQKQNTVYAGRELEKAETAAIGRALGHAGFGTQFADDDEGDFLADSPVDPDAAQQRGRPAKTKPVSTKPRNEQLDKVAPDLFHEIRDATEALWGKKKASDNRHTTVSNFTLARTINYNDLSEDEANLYLQMVYVDTAGRNLYGEQEWIKEARAQIVGSYSDGLTTNLYKMTDIEQVSGLLRELNAALAGGVVPEK